VDAVVDRHRPNPNPKEGKWMCIFSLPVDSVLGTNIFARSSNGNRQYLVYSMTISAREDLAMVLPLPVPPNSPERAVRFISLEGYPNFLTDMDQGFAKSKSPSFGRELESMESLVVHDVGSFQASFVPTIPDFARLDKRFRLPANAWDQLPIYQDYGFAVSKLKRGTNTIHPMAFEFPRRNPDLLYFPTVHIHDGQVHPEAHFDHALYYQADAEIDEHVPMDRSTKPAGHFMDTAKAEEIIEPTKFCYKERLYGPLPNQDTWIGNLRKQRRRAP